MSRRKEIGHRCGRDAVRVGELDRHEGEGEGDDAWPTSFGAGAQPGAALLEDLEVVVGDADQAEPDHEEDDEQPGCGQRSPDQEVGEEVAAR